MSELVLFCTRAVVEHAIRDESILDVVSDNAHSWNGPMIVPPFPAEIITDGINLIKSQHTVAKVSWTEKVGESLFAPHVGATEMQKLNGYLAW